MPLGKELVCLNLCLLVKVKNSNVCGIANPQEADVWQVKDLLRLDAQPIDQLLEGKNLCLHKACVQERKGCF